MKKIIACLLTLMLVFSMVSAIAETPSVAIVVAGTLGDRSFYDSSKEGLDQLAADFGTVTKVIECKEDASMYENGLYEAAEACDIIAAVGWQFWDVLEAGEVLESFPDKKFLFIDNGLEGVGGSARRRIPPHLWPAGHDQPLLEQLRALSVPRKAHPAYDCQLHCQQASAGLRSGAERA